jgi:Flp pilus assembly protein TadD
VLAGLAALALTGCANNGATTTRGPDFSGRSPTEMQASAASLAQRYTQNPRDRNVLIAYAAALRTAGQPEQAIAALEKGMGEFRGDPGLRVEYARALTAAGRFEQAITVIDATINPAAPDWTMLSIKGAALDQLGRNDEARAIYRQAQVMAPMEASLETNLGLSYAMTNELGQAEAHLRRAVAMRGSNGKVRQNLALVIGLQGRFDEARQIYAADLPPAEVEANMAYIKAMLTQQNRWDLIKGAG